MYEDNRIFRADHVAKLNEHIRDLERQHHEDQSELAAMRHQLEGSLPAATAWLQSKVWRQRWAVRRLEGANLRLRFALRIMTRLREPVTAAEWTAARAALHDEDQKKLLGTDVPQAA